MAQLLHRLGVISSQHMENTGQAQLLRVTFQVDRAVHILLLAFGVGVFHAQIVARFVSSGADHQRKQNRKTEQTLTAARVECKDGSQDKQRRKQCAERRRLCCLKSPPCAHWPRPLRGCIWYKTRCFHSRPAPRRLRLTKQLLIEFLHKNPHRSWRGRNKKNTRRSRRQRPASAPWWRQ